MKKTLRQLDVKAWRYLYRSLAHTTEMGPWTPLNKTCPLDTKEGALYLVERWGKKDTGRYAWRVDECLPGDIDHPDQLKEAK